MKWITASAASASKFLQRQPYRSPLGSFALFLGLGGSSALFAQQPSPIGELSTQRIAEIAGYLPEKPEGFGRPIEDRHFWSDPALTARLAPLTHKADELLTMTFPAWDDARYLEYSRDGKRPDGEKMETDRSDWLAPLILAECVENKGRYIPLINQVLEAYANEPTWTLPAHDSHLDCFHRKLYDIDLRTALFGFDLAEALYLVGDRVDPSVQKDLHAALEQRLLEPFRRKLRTGKGCWWLGGSASHGRAINNWNPVCLSGVVGGALMLVPSKTDRALYVAAGEHYSRYYLDSIPEDGYCLEGIAYWSYGFGCYALLREEIVRATQGQIDLFSDPRVMNDVLYGVRFRIGPQAVPPFGDSHFGVTANIKLLSYCNDVLSLNLPFPKFTEAPAGGQIISELMTASPYRAAAKASSVDPLRSYFDQVGVLCCRPIEGSACHLGVGIKSGGNGTHSHNDIGSYAIVIDDEELTGDPGGPLVYDNTTFNAQRYTHELLNSYGHPLPVVAGQLQIDATTAHPKVLSTSFSPDHDSIQIDLKPAYAVNELASLTRTMDYHRAGAGQIEVTDAATFTMPSTFEEALITHGTWTQVDSRTFSLNSGSAKLQVTVDAPQAFTVKPETIQDLGVSFTRIGLIFARPITSTQVRFVFSPEAPR